MFKSLVRVLGILLLTLVVVFVIGELTVRYLQDRTKPPSKVRQRDSLTHHSFKPSTSDIARTPEWESHFSINSQGLRDKEYSLQKPDNTYRILMVGDSFIEGQGQEIENTVSKLLEKSLTSAAINKKVEVINAGVLSYSPLLEYQYLKERGLALNPDLVILNFDMGDVIDDQWYESELIRDAEGQPKMFREPPDLNTTMYETNQFLPFIPKSVKSFFHQNSHLYLVLANSIKNKKLMLYPEIGQAIIKPGIPGNDKLIVTRDNVENYDDLWTLTKSNLRLIKRLLRDRGVDFLLTTYPYGHQVSAEEWVEGRKVWFFENIVYDNDRAFKTLEEFSSSEGIKFHNMTSDFRAEKRHPIFFKTDGHWTKLGHQIAASSLEKYLLDNNYIK